MRAVLASALVRCCSACALVSELSCDNLRKPNGSHLVAGETKRASAGAGRGLPVPLDFLLRRVELRLHALQLSLQLPDALLFHTVLALFAVRSGQFQSQLGQASVMLRGLCFELVAPFGCQRVCGAQFVESGFQCRGFRRRRFCVDEEQSGMDAQPQPSALGNEK
jgi:hypothetical protein